MKLRHLSSAMVGAALLGLLGLSAFSMYTWNILSKQLQTLEVIADLRTQAEQINTLIDYVTLLRSDTHALETLGRDAQALMERFESIEHPLATPVRTHLNEITHLSTVLGNIAPHTSLLHGDAEQRDAMITVTRQMLIQRSGVTDVINTISTELQHDLHASVLGIVSTLVVIAILLTALAIIGFTIMHHRLSRPLYALEGGIRAVARGDLSARIKITGNDELAGLARRFNEMVILRRDHEQALADSERRFRQLTENINDVF